MDPQYQSSLSSQFSSFQFSSPQQPSAHLTSSLLGSSPLSQVSSDIQYSPWYLDSTTTDHITNDLSHLSNFQAYPGSYLITVGDGTSIPIQNTGKGLLPTLRNSFKLNYVLHADSMSSNLVSVQKLAQDNNCIISFNEAKYVI